MTGNDTGLLVVTGSVSSQLENLSSEVLKDSSEIDGSTSTNTRKESVSNTLNGKVVCQNIPLSIVALPQKTMDTTDGESETSLGRTAKGKMQIRNSSKC